MTSVTIFPWQGLPAVPRVDCDALRTLRRSARRLVQANAAVSAARELLASDIFVTLLNSCMSAAPTAASAVSFVNRDEKVWIVVDPEPDLAAAALSRLLDRPIHLAQPGAELDPALQGAMAALALELVRNAAKVEPFAVTLNRTNSMPPQGLRFELAVHLDGRCYKLTVWFASSQNTTNESAPTPLRETIAPDLMLSVPLVVSESSAPAAEITRLECGDVWLAADGWWIDATLHGRGVLCAPTLDFGVGVDVAPGQIVLGMTKKVLSSSIEAPVENRPADTLDQTLAQVPIVVRVELGSVSLSAAQWTELQAGDVLTLDTKVGSPVTLRVSGTVLAQGELVSVDGELGVRITSLPSSRTL